MTDEPVEGEGGDEPPPPDPNWLEFEMHLPGVDEVFMMQYRQRNGIQIVFWPMKLGYPREDH